MTWISRWRYAIVLALVGVVVVWYFLDSVFMYFEVGRQIDRCERAGHAWVSGSSAGCYDIEQVIP